MASYGRCIKEITEAIGRDLTHDEGVRLDKQVTKLVEKLQTGTHAEKFETLLMQEIASAGQTAKAMALVKKRNAIKNKVAVLKIREHLLTHWADDLPEGLESVLVGSMTGRKLGKHSTATAQDALADHYIMMVAADLDKAGVTQWFANGTFDKETWQASWELNRPTPDPAVLKALPREAVATAQIVNKWQEFARVQANRAGAWAKKEDNYVTRRSHDQLRIKDAGEKAWMQDAVEWLDWSKTMPDVPFTEMSNTLRRLYFDLSTGTHIKFDDAPTVGFTAHESPGKQLSHERVLHFKSAEAEYAYNAKYGQGNLRELIFAGLSRAGRETALMRDWGPNARANYAQLAQELVAHLRKAGDHVNGQKLLDKMKRLDRLVWPLLDGEIYRIENATLARYSANVRGIETMADLGGSMLSSFPDIPIYATTARQQGVGMFSGMAEAIGSLTRGASSGERLHVLAELGILLDSVRNTVSQRVDPSGGKTGAVSRAVKTYFKWNLLGPWTDRLRGGFALATSHRLSNHATLKFAELPTGMQHLLRQYGIDDAEWAIVRQGKESHADGKAFLTPEGLADLPASAFAPYLTAQGVATPTGAQIEGVRTDLQTKLRSFFQDQATTAVVQPDTMTKALLYQGTHRGTIQGEAYRHFWMYKGFTMSVMRRVMGRELFGYSDTRGGIMPAILAMLKDPSGSSFVGMANLIATTTVFGYASMTLKELIKGRDPRIPNTPAEYAKVLGASLVQGGGMGLYGDFLFGEMKSRFGQGPLESFMGPTWRRLEDVLTLTQALKEGDDITGRALTKAMNSVPFANLFYTRWAMDYLILYRLQEMSNPGFLRRMEQRVNKEHNQQFIFPPSQVIPYGG